MYVSHYHYSDAFGYHLWYPLEGYLEIDTIIAVLSKLMIYVMYR